MTTTEGHMTWVNICWYWACGRGINQPWGPEVGNQRSCNLLWGVALGINDLQNRICFKRMGIILFKKMGMIILYYLFLNRFMHKHNVLCFLVRLTTHSFSHNNIKSFSSLSQKNKYTIVLFLSTLKYEMSTNHIKKVTRTGGDCAA